jgi:hypothetical protein
MDVLLGVWGPVNYGGYWRPRSKNLVLPVQCSHRCRFAPKYGCHWRECAVCLHINQGIKISKEVVYSLDTHTVNTNTTRLPNLGIRLHFVDEFILHFFPVK